MDKINKKDAIKLLYAIPDDMFGCDKGSGEAYEEYMTRNGFCRDFYEDYPYGDIPDEAYGEDKYFAPGWVEILMAAGISPQEIHDITNINPKCFPDEACRLYGFEPVVPNEQWVEKEEANNG